MKKTDRVPGFWGRRVTLLLPAALLVCAPFSEAQKQVAGTAAVLQSLDRLRTVGSVLMIAAHPDDERTNVLAWSARGRHFRTAYLSLTRGEGGQNLIGNELFEQLGVIRTQELLAARRVDGAEQMFSRAIDFGFSKTAQETMAKWGREEVLSDIVWSIRQFRPDVIILGFTGTTRDGHGHHQTSAILGKEAFRAAADATRFPEQLKWVKPWQARRLFWATAGFMRFAELEDSDRSRTKTDTGEFNPVLGFSYNEIAGQSRSNHRSQGFGAAEPKGSSDGALIVVDGDPVKQDFMEGIDTTWNRLPGGAPVQKLLDEARAAFTPESPDRIVPKLLAARLLIARMEGPDARRKLRELDETVALAAGLWMEVAADRHRVVPGDDLKLTLTAVNRSTLPAQIEAVSFSGLTLDAAVKTPVDLPFNQRQTQVIATKIPADAPYTQLYWLAQPPKGTLYTVEQTMVGLPEGPPALSARFVVDIAGAKIELQRPVPYRYVDPTRGELTRPLVVAPQVVLGLAQHSYLFPDTSSRAVSVEVRANAPAAGSVRLEVPSGWTVAPSEHVFQLKAAESRALATFEIKPPAGESRGTVHAVALVGGRKFESGMTVIAYEHIPPQTLFPPAEAVLVREDILMTARRVGYVMGPGDSVPDTLKQLGCEVTLLDETDLTLGNLSRFDAIVTGVRVWNNRADLRANWPRVLDYVQAGGTLVVQYNDLASFIFGREQTSQPSLGPYPLKIGRDRVTVEDAPVEFLKANHALLSTPNKITPHDFDGWVQERGLYFAAEWDDHYEALFSINDPGEKALRGGLLTTSYGKGVYVFAPLAFFRQLPAGVPGAVKLFANLVSAGKP
jgi:LmbE family N-acetylglucosaminyl deacetylase